jgi:hypothetical protein
MEPAACARKENCALLPAFDLMMLRANGNSGLLFVNNYLRKFEMAERPRGR